MKRFKSGDILVWLNDPSLKIRLDGDRCIIIASWDGKRIGESGPWSLDFEDWVLDEVSNVKHILSNYEDITDTGSIES